MNAITTPIPLRRRDRQLPVWLSLIVTSIVVLLVGAALVYQINEYQQEQAQSAKKAQATMDVPAAVP